MEMRFGVGAVCCEAQDIFIPEQAVQNGVGIQVEQFIALQAPCQDGKALKMRFCAWFVMVTRMRPFFRQALKQDSCGHFGICGKQQGRFQLLAVAHVIFQHLRHVCQ